MPALRLPPTRDRDWWDAIAIDSVRSYMSQVGAAVWPEIEAVLGESPWVRDHLYPDFPNGWGVDPLHLAAARANLIATGDLIAQPIILGGRQITAYLDAPSLGRFGRKTEVQDVAASKRRLYRRWLRWTGTPALCGSVAESVLGASLDALAGRTVWIPPSARIGQVRTLRGRPILVGGPLDGAGAWPADPDNIGLGAFHFAVEVKNVRSTLYPWDNEVWDLLGKLGTHPDVLPVLVARRIHPMTFKMFKDIGALGVNLGMQLFSGDIDPVDFERVTVGLSLHTASRVELVEPRPVLTTFFAKTGPANVEAFLDRWQIVAPIVAEFVDLREEAMPGHRRKAQWAQFAARVDDAGLYDRGGWAPRDVEIFDDDWDPDLDWE